MVNEVVISEAMFSKAATFGLKDPKSELPVMVRLAARVTHPAGNYRYEGLVFRIDNGVLNDLDLYFIPSPSCNDLVVLSDHGNGVVEVVCPDCQNDGGSCNTCVSTGKLKGSWEYLKSLLN